MGTWQETMELQKLSHYSRPGVVNTSDEETELDKKCPELGHNKCCQKDSQFCLFRGHKNSKECFVRCDIDTKGHSEYDED